MHSISETVVGALIKENGLVAAPSQASWRASLRRVALVRLFVLFVFVLAAYIGAQTARVWAVRHVPRSKADWAAVGAALLLSAVLVGIYAGLVRGMERRQARELAPSASLALSGTVLGLALFCAVFGLLELLGFAKWQGLSAHGGISPRRCGLPAGCQCVDRSDDSQRTLETPGDAHDARLTATPSRCLRTQMVSVARI